MDLITNTEIALDVIRNAKSIDEAVSYVRKIDALKVALESVNRFHSESVKYAILEAEALIKVVALGGILKLGTPCSLRYKTAEWLSSLTSDDAMCFINMCRDGLVIEEIYKREIGDVARKDGRIRNAQKCVKEMESTFAKFGFVDMRQPKQYIRTVLGGYEGLADDVIDGARNSLRRSGAIGAGDGIYVSPEIEDMRYVKLAMLIRYESILHDLHNLSAIANTAKVKLTFPEILAFKTNISAYQQEVKNKGVYQKFYGQRDGEAEYSDDEPSDLPALFLALALMSNGIVERDERIYELIKEKQGVEET